MNSAKRNILIAPLNWGLGHATRCIPVINALIENNFNPIIASDGMALQLLKKEFPLLTHLELPPYDIRYPKNGASFKWKLLRSLPQIILASRKENKLVKQWVKTYNLQGIISDNRFGVYHQTVPSVYITHQLKVLSGKTTEISTDLHHYVIQKFDECWVPDVVTRPHLSGKLGRLKKATFKLKYIGLLSRFQKKKLPIIYKLLVVLSGPEPQRTLLETKVLIALSDYVGEILIVRGIVENKQVIEQHENITQYNFMTSEQLEDAINSSAIVLCRSGYSSLMDLSVLEKKVFLIPTPGQYE